MIRIDRGSEPDCDDLPVAGTRARLVLMNYTDVESIFANDDGKIVSITMKPDKQAYEFWGFRSDVKKSDEVLKTRLKSRFKHKVDFVIYERDQLQKNNIKSLVRGRFIAIVEGKGKDDDSIELCGRNVGLQIIAQQVRNAYESGGLFTIGLATPDNSVEFETKLPQTVGTSYSSGLAIIESVLNPVVEEMTFDLTYGYSFDSLESFSFDEE